MNIYFLYETSKYGELLIAEDNSGIFYAKFFSTPQEALSDLKIYLKNNHSDFNLQENKTENLEKAVNYLNHPKMEDLPKLHFYGTDFQKQVWKELLNIPWGETKSYGEVAKNLGIPKASRAVGSAVAKNAIAILVPCHRVILKSGAIGNYAWGKERKIKILSNEKSS